MGQVQAPAEGTEAGKQDLQAASAPAIALVVERMGRLGSEADAELLIEIAGLVPLGQQLDRRRLILNIGYGDEAALRGIGSPQCRAKSRPRPASSS